MDHERAQTLQKLLALDPSDTFSRYALGLEYRDSEPTTALEHLQAVIDRDPDYVPAYFQSGLIQSEQGDFEAAREWLERGIGVARRVGDEHALGEMQEALDQL
jgi:tetratricopeptide (TPR) repeat protein